MIASPNEQTMDPQSAAILSHSSPIMFSEHSSLCDCDASAKCQLTFPIIMS